MGRIVTACKLKFSKKERIYTLTTEHKEGKWEGSQCGAKIYCIGSYLVQTSWGSGKPIAVYTNENEMLLALENAYKVKPILERI